MGGEWQEGFLQAVTPVFSLVLGDGLGGTGPLQPAELGLLLQRSDWVSYLQ